MRIVPINKAAQSGKPRKTGQARTRRIRSAKMDPALTWGMTIAVILSLAFAWWAHGALTDEAWQASDEATARRMMAVSATSPRARHVLAVLTHLGGIPFLTGVAIAGALWQHRQLRRWLAMGTLSVALGGGLLNLTLKESFDRERPPAQWRDPVVSEENESFPSGHAMGSFIGYGLLSYLILLQKWGRRWKVPVILSLCTLMLAIGLSRIYLRAHWVTDVIGGYLIGAAWLSLSLGVLETLRRRRELGEEAPASEVGDEVAGGSPTRTNRSQ